MASQKSKFRPCIDLHNGQVKQIVGGTLTENDSSLKENFVATETSSYYADLYKKHNLTGGHVIKLGPGNDKAAKDALEAWPSGMQVGGGITIENAQKWLDFGASKVIVTSWLFTSEKFDYNKLEQLEKAIGKDKLVVDLSCRREPGSWVVAINKWQTKTDLKITPESLWKISQYCSEFLIHAADVEGLCEGIDTDLVKSGSTSTLLMSVLGKHAGIPTTYAGGAKSIDDLKTVDALSNGKVDLTIGSALDIFGGTKIKFEDCILWNKS